MSIREIYQNLGITNSLDTELRKFNARTTLTIQKLEEELDYHKKEKVIGLVLLEVGMAFNIHSVSELIQDNIGDESMIQNIVILQAFIDTMLDEFSSYPMIVLKTQAAISKIFSSLQLDIGYSLVKGYKIVRAGASELDNELILKNLIWLESYPDSRAKFSNSLKYLLTKDYSDAFTNAYSALEGIVKSFLGTKKNLHDEKTISELISALKLDSGMGQILNRYCNLANDISSRHGKKDQEIKVSITPEVTEFYVYMTGSILRLIAKSTGRDQKL